jgi:radical SAM protein
LTLQHGLEPTAVDPRRVNLDRDPVVVFWEITLACALACRHCRALAQPKRSTLELSSPGCYRVLKELTSFDHPPILVLSGGDPFMRRDLFDLVERGMELGLPMSVAPAATALATRQRFQRLANLGVSRISLSLDGSGAAVHDRFRGVEGSFGLTMKAMANARDAGLAFQVNTTVTRQTVEDLPAIAEVVASSRAVLWDLFFLVPTGRAAAEDAIPPEEHERVFGWICDLSERVPFTVKTTLGQHYRRVQVLRRLAAEGQGLDGLAPHRVRELYRGIPSNDGKGILFISHRGDVCPSGFLPISAGNVRSDSVVDLYRDSALFRSLRNPAALKGKCGRCPFNVICGGCRARAYATTGDPLAPEPYCIFQPGEEEHQPGPTLRP